MAPRAADDWGSAQASAREGAASPNAALTDADAVRIRQRRAAGISPVDLAQEYGVSVATIGRITQGRTYRNATAQEEAPPSPIAAPKPPRNVRHRDRPKILPDRPSPRLRALAPSIRRMASKGWSADAIAIAEAISRKEVCAILGVRSKRCVLDDAGEHRVRELHAEGLSETRIAKILGVARSTVHRALPPRVNAQPKPDDVCWGVSSIGPENWNNPVAKPQRRAESAAATS
jgi:IS30 family transposase